MATPSEVMEHIWDKIPKNEDNKTITYSNADLIYLYYEGFVDARTYSLKKWQKAFLPFLDKNKTFTLNKTQFLTLRKYRYNGPSDEMFDTYKIRDGAWTDEELAILYSRSIKQASEMPEDIFWKLVNDLKKSKFVDEKGLFVIDDNVKKALSFTISAFPSPRTRLEYKVKMLKEKGSDNLRQSEQEKGKSKFAAGTTAVETTLASLQKLQSTSSAKKQPEEPKTDKKDEIDLKKLRKPKGKVFG